MSKRLDEILEQVVVWANSDGRNEVGLSYDEAKSAILSYFLEILPEKQKEFGGTHADVQMSIGFNSCLSQITEAIEKERGV